MERHNEALPQVDYDGQWKSLMTKHAVDFIEFFFSEDFVATLDFEKGVDTNTDDLLKFFPDFGKDGKVLPDKLFKVFQKTGDEGFVLIHVEVEKSPKNTVTGRMFQYFIRLKELFPDAKITALVLYIGETIPKNYKTYEYSFGGTNLTYNFNTYQVKQQSEQKLLQSQNPFALAVLACLYLIKSKKDIEKRGRYKRKLARLCLERNYPTKYIRDFLLFINFTIALPTKDDVIYYQEILPVMSKEKQYPYQWYPFAAQMNTKIIWGKTMDEMLEEKEAEVKAYFESLLNKVLERTEFIEAKAKEQEAKAKEQEAKAKEQEAQIQKSVLNLYKNGIDIKVIAASFEITEEEVQKIISTEKK